MMQAPETLSLSMKMEDGHSRITFDCIDYQNTHRKVKPMLTSIPHENWSTIECRMWLLRIMRDCMDLQPETAVRYALTFNGQGSTMLRQSVEKWMSDFGDLVGGIIHATIAELLKQQ